MLKNMAAKCIRSILLSAAAVIVLSGINALAQQAPAETRPMDADTSKDDILLLVNVTAKELKFDVVPNTTVEFPGTPKRTTIWVTDRQNLPDKIEPGVTYRNIGIQLRISSRFEDIDRIVREALGEEPKPAEPVQPPASAAKPPAEPVHVATVRHLRRKK